MTLNERAARIEFPNADEITTQKDGSVWVVDEGVGFERDYEHYRDHADMLVEKVREAGKTSTEKFIRALQALTWEENPTPSSAWLGFDANAAQISEAACKAACEVLEQQGDSI